MLKNLVILSTLMLLHGSACNQITTPDVEKDPNWIEDTYKDGLLLPNDIVSFYKEHYPEYYSNNRELMSVLTEQYQNRVASIIEDNFKYYSFPLSEPNSTKLKELIYNQIESDYQTSEFTINGCRIIDKTDKLLFNRIYKWYNFGYSDGFYLNIYSDEDLFKKVPVTKRSVQSASIIVDCTIELDEDIKSNELLFFDKEENYLFKIIVSQ